MASSRQPAGSEGELACGGEQKNISIIKIIKTQIFMTSCRLHRSCRAKKVVAAKLNPFDTVFPYSAVNGVFFGQGRNSIQHTVLFFPPYT